MPTRPRQSTPSAPSTRSPIRGSGLTARSAASAPTRMTPVRVELSNCGHARVTLTARVSGAQPARLELPRRGHAAALRTLRLADSRLGPVSARVDDGGAHADDKFVARGVPQWLANCVRRDVAIAGLPGREEESPLRGTLVAVHAPRAVTPHDDPPRKVRRRERRPESSKTTRSGAADEDEDAKDDDGSNRDSDADNDYKHDNEPEASYVLVVDTRSKDGVVVCSTDSLCNLCIALTPAGGKAAPVSLRGAAVADPRASAGASAAFDAGDTVPVVVAPSSAKGDGVLTATYTAQIEPRAAYELCYSMCVDRDAVVLAQQPSTPVPASLACRAIVTNPLPIDFDSVELVLLPGNSHATVAPGIKLGPKQQHLKGRWPLVGGDEGKEDAGQFKSAAFGLPGNADEKNAPVDGGEERMRHQQHDVAVLHEGTYFWSLYEHHIPGRVSLRRGATQSFALPDADAAVHVEFGYYVPASDSAHDAHGDDREVSSTAECCFAITNKSAHTLESCALHVSIGSNVDATSGGGTVLALSNGLNADDGDGIQLPVLAPGATHLAHFFEYSPLLFAEQLSASRAGREAVLAFNRPSASVVTSVPLAIEHRVDLCNTARAPVRVFLSLAAHNLCGPSRPRAPGRALELWRGGARIGSTAVAGAEEDGAVRVVGRDRAGWDRVTFCIGAGERLTARIAGVEYEKMFRTLDTDCTTCGVGEGEVGAGAGKDGGANSGAEHGTAGRGWVDELLRAGSEEQAIGQAVAALRDAYLSKERDEGACNAWRTALQHAEKRCGAGSSDADWTGGGADAVSAAIREREELAARMRDAAVASRRSRDDFERRLQGLSELIAGRGEL